MNPLEALKACKAAVENKELPPSARLELVRDFAAPAIQNADGAAKLWILPAWAAETIREVLAVEARTSASNAVENARAAIWEITIP